MRRYTRTNGVRGENNRMARTWRGQHNRVRRYPRPDCPRWNHDRMTGEYRDIDGMRRHPRPDTVRRDHDGMSGVVPLRRDPWMGRVTGLWRDPRMGRHSGLIAGKRNALYEEKCHRLDIIQRRREENQDET